MKPLYILMLIVFFVLPLEHAADGADRVTIDLGGHPAASRALVRPLVVLRDRRALRAAARHDYGLSKACRQGEFLQSRTGHYVAVLDGEIYGAAIGGQISLQDLGDFAKTGQVYVFIGQGASYCRVFKVEDGPSQMVSGRPTA